MQPLVPVRTVVDAKEENAQCHLAADGGEQETRAREKAESGEIEQHPSQCKRQPARQDRVKRVFRVQHGLPDETCKFSRIQGVVGCKH